ncbi:Hpt domain-containing protein [Roseibium sp.]|uniref:Hpt domain-containing protein n=2 Tax=Roseibium sp. TaxID=1936156 RepID=UPI003266371D
MTEAVQARAAQLFTAFEKRLDHDRAELIANGDTAAGRAGGPDFDAVRFIAHRIVGSARMFGCEDLAEPAGKVEGLVDAGADVSAIVQAVNELAERIELTLSKGLGSPDWNGFPS